MYTNEPYWKSQLREARVNYDFTLEQNYCATDSMVTIEIWDVIKHWLKRDDLDTTYATTISKLTLVQRIQDSGFRVDHKGVARERQTLSAELVELRAELNVITSERIADYLRPDIEELERLDTIREEKKADSL